MKCVVLVGPPGSGKSSLAYCYGEEGAYVRVSQDDQGKDGHMSLFMETVAAGENVVVDRMNFNKEQRNRYLSVAKANGYSTEIVVIHESYKTCWDRCVARQDHPTIKDSAAASKALHFFFKSYERPTDDEADKVTFLYPEGEKPKAVICDLDGTLANIDHRLHYVSPKDGSKKNWKKFFEEIPNDRVNEWCADIINAMSTGYTIVYCSGRDENQRKNTTDWLAKNGLDYFLDSKQYGETYIAPLFMRGRDDYRQDYIIKENILDFEILTRYKPVFMIDDRKQVVDMWRRRGFTCLQCAEGDF